MSNNNNMDDSEVDSTGLPSCANSCFNALQSEGCDPNDVTCWCQQPVSQKFFNCAVKNCDSNDAYNFGYWAGTQCGNDGLTFQVNPNDTNTGLSKGAKAGIGIGVALGVIIIAGALAFLFIFMRRRNRNRRAANPTPVAPQVQQTGGVPPQQPQVQQQQQPYVPPYPINNAQNQDRNTIISSTTGTEQEKSGLGSTYTTSEQHYQTYQGEPNREYTTSPAPQQHATYPQNPELESRQN